MTGDGRAALKRFSVIVILAFCLFAHTAFADVGGICAEGVDHFDHSYELKFDSGAFDMVRVAEKQIGKTTSDLGYHGFWCAAFINDCAKLAGQENAIPFISDTTGTTHVVDRLYKAVRDRGGKEVTEPKTGDLCFYYCSACNGYTHVGLCAGNGYYIDGNFKGTVKKYSMGWTWSHSPDVNTTHTTADYIRRIYVRPNYGSPSFAAQDFDVNGMLDGVVSGNLGPAGTFDIKIGDDPERFGLRDFNGSYKPGTKFKITVHANPGYKYIGPQQTWWNGLASVMNVEDTVRTYTTKITLGFETLPNGILTVGGMVDGVETADLTGYARFDVIVNEEQVATGVSHYSGSHKIGSPYRITNIELLKDNVTLVQQDFEGVITAGETKKAIRIVQIAHPTAEWQYCSALPSGLDREKVEVQQKYTYEVISSTSPGEEWTKGELASSEYQNVGNAYTTSKQETTSDTLKLVKWEYYHWCKTTGGNIANYTYDTSKEYVHEDVISNTSSVTEAGSGMDGNYPYYYLKWSSTGNWAYCHGGTTCSGSDHPDRSYVWYKRYTYQRQEKVEKWRWTKETDWQTMEETGAAHVEYRYRLLIPEVSWDLTLPDKLIIIDEEAFRDNARITSVKLGNSVQKIGKLAFAGCTSMAWAFIPDSVVTIDESAFEDGVSLICESDNVGARFGREHGLEVFIIK